MVETSESFINFKLSDQILAALSDLKWEEPTEIQKAVVPLIIDGKNVLACAQTGSGKTGAFVIPIVHNVLLSIESGIKTGLLALILAPTKELCAQIERNVREITKYCSKLVRCLNVSGQTNHAVLQPQLSNLPQIIVGTPSCVLSLVKASKLSLSSMRIVVVDEADLIFSFGYSKEVHTLCAHFPLTLQAILLSATLGKDVKALRKNLLKQKTVWSRVELTGESALPDSQQLTQYVLSCEEEDKFLLIYSLVKLKLIRGKTLVFVNSVDRGYRVKLFLEQFGIRSAMLNSELPSSSRLHVVQQFNKGLYDIVIASDESIADEPSKSRRHKDKEFGVSRGIDFQLVSNVLNFDFPPTFTAYLHRVGRTSRANQKGTALSFVSEKESAVHKEVEKGLPGGLRPYQFRMEELDGFRYRARDAMRAVTSAAVREARMKEIKQEMLQSAKLRSYFQDNPRDLHVLRHDKELHTAKVHTHLRHVPEYIVPQSLRDMMPGQRRNRAARPHYTQEQKRRKRIANDPLFSAQAALHLGAKRKKK